MQSSLPNCKNMYFILKPGCFEQLLLCIQLYQFLWSGILHIFFLKYFEIFTHIAFEVVFKIFV